MKVFSKKDLKEAAMVLKNDGVLSVATDTVFGICARFDHEKAQERLRLVKNRPLTKAFPIVCANLEQVRSIAVVNKREEEIIQAFLPGPLTLVLKKQDNLPSFVNGGLDSVAIRIVPREELNQLIELVGVPLFLTSANQSGEKTCTSLEEIEEACPLLDGMMDGNPDFKEASTILDCTKETLAILREGPISLEEILERVGK